MDDYMEKYLSGKSSHQGKGGTKFGPKQRLSPEVASLRRGEICRRYSSALHRAHKALTAQHPDEFAAYLEIARAEVASERGALPGDTTPE
jgi:hypothetical protein